MILQLTFLQYNQAATISRTLLLFAICLAIVTPLVYAIDNVSLISENQNSVCFSDGGQGFQCPLEPFNDLELHDGLDARLTARAPNTARRVPPSVAALGNNQFKHDTIKIGETQWWYFPKEAVNGKKSNITSSFPPSIGVGGKAGKNRTQLSNGIWKRSQTVYISLTTCSKPNANNPGSNDASDLPQLEVYISKSESLQKPGPGKDDSAQTVHTAHQGYMGTTVQADGDIFIGVAAPKTTAYKGEYGYQIAASIDDYFHTIDDFDPFLYFLDADVNAALLVSNNLTQTDPGSDNYKAWMDLSAPYTMFAHSANDTALAGLERSYCALNKHAQVSKRTHDVGASMTNRGLGNKPKEQFYVTGLNRSSFYYGILAREGNGTKSGNAIVGGGGKVWKAMNFTTKAGRLASIHSQSAKAT